MTSGREQSVIEADTLETVRLGDHFKITPQGLFVSGRPSIDQFESLGETLRTLDKSVKFAVFDYFREVEERFGERGSQLIDASKWSEETLRVYRWTYKKVPQAVRRMDKLTMSHHQVVAKLTPKEQKKWLDRAAEGDERAGVAEPWSVSHLKSAVRAGADPVVKMWVVVAYCDSEEKRDELAKELEARGIHCKLSERRSDKEVAT